MTPSLEGWPTRTKEAPLHEVRLSPLDTKLVFQCLRGKHYETCIAGQLFDLLYEGLIYSYPEILV